MTSATERTLHLLFWSLIFIVFPLGRLPDALVRAFPTSIADFQEEEQIETLVPKVITFVLLWALGVGLILWRAKRLREGGVPLSRLWSKLVPTPARRTFIWLGAFILALITASMFSPANLNFGLPFLSNQSESVVIKVLESAWYSLALIAAILASSRVLPPRVPLGMMVGGAALVGLWTILEAHGFEPMSLLDPQTQLRPNLLASMGHQAYVSAFVSVVLVFWFSWRVLEAKFNAVDGVLVTILAAALVASGGRAGLLAAVTMLTLFVGYLFYAKRHRKRVTVLCVLVVIAGFSVTQTSTHAQFRMGRLSAAVQGEDANVSHRMILWHVAAQAIRERPLTGHGAYALANLVWPLATPEQADTLMREFLPEKIAQDAFRVGKLAVYTDPETGNLTLTSMNPYGVHNYFLDIAFASGLPATLLFIGFVVSCFTLLYRAHTPLALATFLALAAYLLYGMFWFATQNVDPLVWTLVGLGIGSASSALPQAEAEQKQGVRLEATSPS